VNVKPASRDARCRLLPLSVTLTGAVDSLLGNTPAFSSVFRIDACNAFAKSVREARPAWPTLPGRTSSPLRFASEAVENETVYVLPLSVTFAVPVKFDSASSADLTTAPPEPTASFVVVCLFGPAVV